MSSLFEAHNRIVSLEIKLEKAQAVMDVLLQEYFDKSDPDPQILKYYYNYTATMAHIVADYHQALGEEIEKLKAELEGVKCSASTP